MIPLQSKFKSNSLIKIFKEFSLFTKITALSSTNTFQASTIESIILPTSINALNYGSCFQDCKNLAAINLHEGITNIAMASFRSCTKLKVLEIPSTVSSIGSMFAMSCTCIMIFKGSTPPTGIPAGVERGRAFGSGKIYVPDEAVDTYKGTADYSSVASRIYPISEYTG